MSSESVPPEPTPPPTVPPLQQPPHPNITFTFPIVFITNPPSSSTSSDPGLQDVVPPEEVQGIFSRMFRSFPMPFAAQFEPVPNGSPKKHATQSALDTLKPVEVSSLPEGDRRCLICMQDYFVKPVGPRSPYVEDIKDEDDQDVSSKALNNLMRDQGETSVEGEEQVAKDEGEKPLEMSCGHVFGSTCLKEWLYQSPTCPLCREEVESYTDEPETTPGVFPPFEGPFPWPQPPSTDPNMQVDSESTDQQQSPPILSGFAFQFILTPAPRVPAPTPAPAPTATSNLSTPNISRPSSAHTIRHHPYSRSSTSFPLSAPSITDRPDLFCAQRGSGLCSHDISNESLIRLECGHAFHADCLEGSMIVEGYSVEQEGRRCPRCRRWMSILQ